ncbi:hypothetical protein HDU79_000730 [Rhizoclosmatium sp. JEL0117]|nr:hypothetical protein HDU79_000730 [Rhizoclosmatium sp. JEL0117]
MSPRRRFTKTIRLNASTSQEYLADDSEQIQSAQLSPLPPPTSAADSLKQTGWPLTMVTNETESDEQIIVMAQKRSFELMRNGSVSPPTQISGVSTLSSRGSGGNANEDDLVNGGVVGVVVGSGGEERNRRASHALPKLVGIPVSGGVPVGGGGPTSPLHQQLQQQLQQQQRSSVTISRGIVSTGTVVVSSSAAEVLEHHSSVAHVVSDSTSTISAISETATPVIGVPVQTVRTGFALVDIDNPITRTGSSKATIVD